MPRGRSGSALGRRIGAIRKRIQRGPTKTVFRYATRYVPLDESEARHTTGVDSGRDARSSSLVYCLEDDIVFLRSSWGAKTPDTPLHRAMTQVDFR